jgi:hypothetical protein
MTTNMAVAVEVIMLTAIMSTMRMMMTMTINRGAG